MQTIYKGQTLHLFFEIVDDLDRPVALLNTAVADLRISFGGGIQSFPGVVDAPAGTITITVDRDITRTWRRGEYPAQVWLDYGEGEPVEAEVIHADLIEIVDGF